MLFDEFIKIPYVQYKLQQLLEQIKDDLKKKIKNLNDIASSLAAGLCKDILGRPLISTLEAIENSTDTLRNSLNITLLPRRAFVQSLIQKLSQPQLELSPDEQGFLIRLFLASKLSSPELMTSELEQCMKNLKMMFDTIALTLFRYYSIHQCCPEAFVRSYLCSIGKEREFYDPTNSGSFCTFDVIRRKEQEYDEVRKELANSAKIFCVETYNMFNQRLSTFEFNKLMSEFQSGVSKFSERFGCGNQIYEIAFNRELFDSNFMNYLLVSLLTFESKFIEEKQKLQDFSNQFAASLKEILEKIELINHKQYEYKTTDFGYADHQPTPRSSYTEPFEESRDLAALLNAVLENKCQQNCECNHRLFVNGQWKPNLDQIVHKPVVMTPAEIAQVGRFVASFSEELLK
jgi:hypothetical protein